MSKDSSDKEEPSSDEGNRLVIDENFQKNPGPVTSEPISISGIDSGSIDSGSTASSKDDIFDEGEFKNFRSG